MERHPVEFAINKHYIDMYIQPGMRELDVGGGPGRYSLHLAERGCDVTLVDLSAGNVEFARNEAQRQGLRLRANRAMRVHWAAWRAASSMRCCLWVRCIISSSRLNANGQRRRHLRRCAMEDTCLRRA